MPEDAVVLASRYRLRERIGAGGMGEVWRATDDVLGRTVAVKLILPELLDEPGFVRRFLAEARAMASVRHPGVVAIHDFHGDAARAYLVMEYVDGESLSRVLGRSGRLDPAATMDIVRQAARALQAVHDRGIVHRDVKPANLLLRPDRTLALADFGIAVGVESTALTGSGAILGTPSYLAPEQVMGQAASPRSDVYSLGVIAYECLAGRRPFVGDNPFAVAMQRVGQAPPPLGRDVPPAVANVVARALEPDPARRWPSAAEFARAAERAGASLPSGAAASAADTRVVAYRGDATTVRSKDAAHPRRRLSVTLVALALAVLGAGVVGVVLARTGPADPSTAVDVRTSGPTGASSPTGGGPASAVPRGFVACGDGLCPSEPMCWRGLVQVGDVGRPPAPADCAEPHYWETFVAGYLPHNAVTDRDLSHLMERPDMAALCSIQAMAERSRAPTLTASWRREAWPIPADPYTVVVHCLAGAVEGETPGALFGSG